MCSLSEQKAEIADQRGQRRAGVAELPGGLVQRRALMQVGARTASYCRWLRGRFRCHHASRAVAGILLTALLVRLGTPALALLVFAILVLGVIRMILARQGDARYLTPGTSRPPSRASQQRRRPTQRRQTAVPEASRRAVNR